MRWLCIENTIYLPRTTQMDHDWWHEQIYSICRWFSVSQWIMTDGMNRYTVFADDSVSVSGSWLMAWADIQYLQMIQCQSVDHDWWHEQIYSICRWFSLSQWIMTDDMSRYTVFADDSVSVSGSWLMAWADIQYLHMIQSQSVDHDWWHEQIYGICRWFSVSQWIMTDDMSRYTVFADDSVSVSGSWLMTWADIQYLQMIQCQSVDHDWWHEQIYSICIWFSLSQWIMTDDMSRYTVFADDSVSVSGSWLMAWADIQYLQMIQCQSVDHDWWHEQIYSICRWFSLSQWIMTDGMSRYTVFADDSVSVSGSWLMTWADIQYLHMIQSQSVDHDWWHEQIYGICRWFSVSQWIMPDDMSRYTVFADDSVSVSGSWLMTRTDIQYLQMIQSQSVDHDWWHEQIHSICRWFSLSQWIMTDGMSIYTVFADDSVSVSGSWLMAWADTQYLQMIQSQSVDHDWWHEHIYSICRWFSLSQWIMTDGMSIYTVFADDSVSVSGSWLMAWTDTEYLQMIQS